MWMTHNSNNYVKFIVVKSFTKQQLRLHFNGRLKDLPFVVVRRMNGNKNHTNTAMSKTKMVGESRIRAQIAH